MRCPKSFTYESFAGFCTLNKEHRKKQAETDTLDRTALRLLITGWQTVTFNDTQRARLREMSGEEVSA